MREQDVQRLLKLSSLVTFLFSDKKVTHSFLKLTIRSKKEMAGVSSCHTILLLDYLFFSSSGVKSRVISFRLVRSWVNFTPADIIIRLEARVDMESAYLSER